MNKAIIFDLDGTLIDSLPDIVDSINKMNLRYGYKEVTIFETMPNIGYGARHLVKNSIPKNLTDEEIDERLNCYNEIYTSSNSPKTGIFDGVSEVLKILKNRGYKLAILTNKPHETTVNVYQTYLKDFGFDLVVGASDKIKHKPDPSGVLGILKTLGVEKENAYFVGDGETDVLTAKNAEIKSVAVLWGYRDKACLKEAGATLFADKPCDLLKIFK